MFHLLLPLLNKLGPGWCLLLLSLKQVFLAWMQWCIISAGSAACKASEVWKADLQAVLPAAPGHQMFHHPGLHVSHEPFAARRLSNKTVLRRFCFDEHDTRDNTLPRCCVHMKRSAQRRETVSTLQMRKRRGSSKMSANYLVFIWVWKALVKVSQGVFQYEELHVLPGTGITVSHGLHSHHCPVKH